MNRLGNHVLYFFNDLLAVEIYPDAVENPVDGIADQVEYPLPGR